jgi:hydroxymethylbilane synthase
MPDGSEIMTESKIIDKDSFKGIGREMAQEMIKRGAKDVLARAEEMASIATDPS